MVNRIPIEKLSFTNNAAKEFLEKTFRDKEIKLSNYYY